MTNGNAYELLQISRPPDRPIGAVLLFPQQQQLQRRHTVVSQCNKVIAITTRD